MKLPRRRFLHLVAGTAVLPAVSRIARAQTYPTRPIAMIVPASAGGPTDAIGRIMAQRMRVSLGQTVIVEDVSGAGGSIGVGRVARSAPDGYTIGIGRDKCAAVRNERQNHNASLRGKRSERGLGILGHDGQERASGRVRQHPPLLPILQRR